GIAGWAEDQGRHTPTVPPDRGLPVAGSQVPQLDRTVLIPPCQGLPIWIEGHGMEVASDVVLDGGEPLAASQVPDLDRVTNRQVQSLASRRESHIRQDAYGTCFFALL